MLERIVSVPESALLAESDGSMLHLRRIPTDSHSGDESTRNGANGGETVLVVDDNRALRKLLAKGLRLRGYQTLTAADGLEAIQVAENHSGRIDALITDVDMPRLGGIEVAVQLTRMRPEVRVLFISGRNSWEMDPKELLAPGSFFLQKPFTLDQLGRMLREALNMRRIKTA